MKPAATRDFLLLGMGLAIAVALKAHYAQCSTADLAWLLDPVRRIVGFFTGSPSHFDPDLGYHFPQLHITIDRSCSGLNFLVMAFCMIGISTLSFYRRLGPQVLALAIGALATYLLTLGATSSRILIAIRSWQLRELYPWLASDRMHQLQGGFVYLFFLILFYLLTTFLHQKMSQRYA